MFTRWVVPLDGSETAEAVLPWVERLAPRCNAEVVLLAVVSLGSIARDLSGDQYITAAVYEQVIQGEKAALNDYLAKVGERLTAAGCRTAFQVLVGQPASAIIDTAAEDVGETLVAMTTHGRTGLARFALGSVAGQVVRALPVPVLLVRSGAQQRPTLDTMLVPLDGSATAEAVLPAVEMLAPAFGTRVLLLTVSGESDGPASAYLERIAARLSSAGITDVETRIIAGSPAEVILSIAGQTSADIIAMATHGRTGVRHWVLGSVAEDVLHQATVPVLLVRGRHERE
jgi:nucleotide-binding universal stress UspA family protein